MRHTATRLRGYSLIELLVAVLVLAIGLLGVAALQTDSLKLNSDAYLRTQAQVLVDDLAERMRANWDDGNTLANYITTFASTDSGDCDVRVFGQSDAARKADIGCWLLQVERTLGSEFSPTFAVNATDAAYADIRLGWRDRELHSETECDNFGASREWRNPTVAAGEPAQDPACFVLFQWSVSL